MKRSTQFLQVVTVLVGLAALAALIWEPQIEGRNAHATLFEIYLKDPFLAYGYIASIPFFAGLYQVFTLLGYIGKNEFFSEASLKALQTIKKCGFLVIGFVAGAILWIILSNSEDKPPGFFMGFLIVFGSLIVISIASVCEKILRSKT